MNETSWDTVQRIDRSDPYIDTLRLALYENLKPELYRAPVADRWQRCVAANLEHRNHAERINRAARAVAGFHTPGFQPEEVAA
jgi:hypothetical protein